MNLRNETSGRGSENQDMEKGLGYQRKVYTPEITVAIAHADQAGSGMDILDTWAQELKKFANGMGYTVIDICGSDLTYECLTEILEVTKPAVLFNFSVGTEYCLIGNDMKCTLTGGEDVTSCMTPTCTFERRPLKLRRKNNLNVVAGTAVIAYSSRAASQLGLEIIKAENLMNAYQEITGEKIRLKLGAEMQP